MSVQEKFAQVRQDWSDSLIERDAEIDLVLTGLLSREHPLLVGPPGTAKSMLCDALVDWVSGDKFSVQLNKFSKPEEVFGPLSVVGLSEDKYRRAYDGYLPTAHVAYIDEIFKASSAILNTMLRILNERTFVDDLTTIECPLMISIAASNEWPNSNDGGQELDALFDRLTLRKNVEPIVREESLERLLWSKDLNPKHRGTITAAEVRQAQQEAAGLEWNEEAKELFLEIIKEANKEGIIPGDRRMRKTVGVCKSFAYLCGGDKVEREHLEITAHTLWVDHEEQPKTIEKIVVKKANPSGMAANSLLGEVSEILSKADLKDLGEAATATKKLQEIKKKLKKLPDGPKVNRARDYVENKLKEILVSSLADAADDGGDE